MELKYRIDLKKESRNINNNDNDNLDKIEKSSSTLKKKRRSSNQILLENSIYLKNGIEKILPQISSAVDNKINESNTRMIIDRMFIDIFGYKIEEVKAEQKIQGRIVDYILSVDDVDALVVEVKKAGMKLSAQHIFQATSYGAYSGIEWVLLTNLSQWKFYHISICDKVEYDLIFDINIESGLSHQEARNLNLISRYAMSRKGLRKRKYHAIKSLCFDNVKSVIMTEDTFNKIRLSIQRDNNCVITNKQVQKIVEDVLKIG